jgi:hypothetical protein
MGDVIFFSPKISKSIFFLGFLFKHSVGVEYKIPEINIWVGVTQKKIYCPTNLKVIVRLF